MKLLKVCVKLLLYVAAVGGIWLACALLLPKIKREAETRKELKEVTIYVRTNGAHTDIVMPRNMNLPNS
ncbi:MAG: urease-associated protein, partial [Bacteroidia bacterium]|nr:urease-associated protein [Bacteroidia bacterium]